MTFLAYRGTLQERALGLVAAKVKAALIVAGELPDDGLAGLDIDDHDQILALAKCLVDPEAADDASLEAMFAETRTLEAAAEDALDEAHRLDPEPANALATFGAMPYPAAQASPAAAEMTPVTIPTRRVVQLPLDLVTTAPAVAPTGDRAGEEPTLPPPIGRVVRFEDLALLARPRARRRKAAPIGQLDLFAS